MHSFHRTSLPCFPDLHQTKPPEGEQAWSAGQPLFPPRAGTMAGILRLFVRSGHRVQRGERIISNPLAGTNAAWDRGEGKQLL